MRLNLIILALVSDSHPARQSFEALIYYHFIGHTPALWLCFLFIAITIRTIQVGGLP